MTIRILNMDEGTADHTPAWVEMFYDPHFRHWVLYPVDAEGNQLREASYAFGKKEALQVKAEIEQEIKDGNRNGYYYE